MVAVTVVSDWVAKPKSSPRRVTEREKATDLVVVLVGWRRLFFLDYSLHACDLWRSWRDYVQPVSCRLSAQWRLIASTPLPSAQACPRRCVARQRNYKGKEASVRKREREKNI